MSLLLHGILLGLLVARGERLWNSSAHPGLMPGDPAASGGGGGSRVAYITLPPIARAERAAPKPQPIVPPRQVAEPRPDPEPRVVAPAAIDTAPSPRPASQVGAGDSTPGPGTGQGNGGVGRGPGAGAGAGGTGGPGAGGGRGYPPEPRDMAFPFDNPPKELRGVSLNVTFWVRVDGRVERYLVEPEIKDRDYAKKFDEVMRAFRFTPARAPDGTRVPGTTRISFTLPGKSNS